MRQLWHTGYVVSSLLFLILSYFEWQIPGFVSLVFPVYIVLLIALVCGVASLMVARPHRAVGRTHELAAVAGGLILAVTMFHAAGVFGAFRLVLALLVFVLPIVLLKTLNDVKD